jgi:hypothetical protein
MKALQRRGAGLIDPEFYSSQSGWIGFQIATSPRELRRLADTSSPHLPSCDPFHERGTDAFRALEGALSLKKPAAVRRASEACFAGLVALDQLASGPERQKLLQLNTLHGMRLGGMSVFLVSHARPDFDAVQQEYRRTSGKWTRGSAPLMNALQACSVFGIDVNELMRLYAL